MKKMQQFTERRNSTPLLLMLALIVSFLAGCTGQGAELEVGPPEVASTAAPGEAVDDAAQAQPASPVAASPEVGERVPDLAGVELELTLAGDGFRSPVGLTYAPDGSGRLFVNEQQGRIYILRDGQKLSQPFLDLRLRLTNAGFEQGLLGLAFHPDYANNGYLYVNYTDRAGNTVVARYSVSAGNSDEADPDSELILLQVEQPAGNHNGGNLVFGPDGYLYIGLGDGGAAGDRFGNGQRTNTMLGSMLRIDVDEGVPYGIPSDNPFVGDPNALDELWAYGLRNPWRYSFDRATGDLYIADVGQNSFEEVNFQSAISAGGENYGWPIMEARSCFREANCAQEGLALPVAEYGREGGCSISGGYVYRGQAYPALQSIYLFGDFCSGIMWGLSRDEAGGWQMRLMLESGLSISSFGEDEVGEVYVLDHDGGDVYRIGTR